MTDEYEITVLKYKGHWSFSINKNGKPMQVPDYHGSWGGNHFVGSTIWTNHICKTDKTRWGVKRIAKMFLKTSNGRMSYYVYPSKRVKKYSINL